jgi:parallel beta-helix repeat protein
MSYIRIPAALGRWLPITLVLTAMSSAAFATTYDVYTDADFAPLLAHDWNNPSVGLQPGDEVIVHGGTYSNEISISAQGTSAAPIDIHALAGDPSGPPIVSNSVIFDASQYVTVDGLHLMTGCPTYDGALFVNGATANTITNADISSCNQGIATDPSAGADNVISNNTVHGNPNAGIYLNGSATANGTHVFGNIVHNNGYDGIAISGNNAIVEYNTSYANGQASIGTSGIHVFAGYSGAPTGYGQNNIIRYNIVYGESDYGGPHDGNGIELDLYAVANQVYFNEVHGNDGDGIVLFGAESNWVFNNTIYQNGQDTAHVSSDLEITGNTSDSSGSFSGVSINNIIANNLIGSLSTSPSIAVEIDSVSNTIGNQLIVPGSGGAIDVIIESYSGTVLSTYTTIAAWNTAKGQTPDIAADPLFVNPSAVTPTTGPAKNLSLQSTSSPAYQTGGSPLSLPTPITVTVDLWQALNNPSTSNIDPYHPPIGAYTVDP